MLGWAQTTKICLFGRSLNNIITATSRAVITSDTNSTIPNREFCKKRCCVWMFRLMSIYNFEINEWEQDSSRYKCCCYTSTFTFWSILLWIARWSKHIVGTSSIWSISVLYRIYHYHFWDSVAMLLWKNFIKHRLVQDICRRQLISTPAASFETLRTALNKVTQLQPLQYLKKVQC